MAWTVLSAFEQFRKDIVDLNPELTNRARSSRDYLFGQIEVLAKNNKFPKIISSDPFINFGSFARKTKIRLLNDIDFLVVLNAKNITLENVYNDLYTYNLKVIKSNTYFLSSPSITLEQFSNKDGYINSVKVLNYIKSNLSSINNYRKAEIKKTMEAVTLNLKSYDWVYDIVPAILVQNHYIYSQYFYLIPNGHGQWIATNPRIDANNTTRVNLKHNGKFLPTLRLLKYWNNRTNKPILPSYYFETLAVKVFENAQIITNFPNSINYFFAKCPFYMSQPCPDPKNLGVNLDKNIEISTKRKVIDTMKKSELESLTALIYESKSDYKYAINCWQKIFGGDFPSYG